MSLKRAQILDPIGNTTPLFYETSAGHEVDNAFNGPFGASNAKVECEIEGNTKSNQKYIEITDIETFDYSQFVNGYIQHSGFHRSRSQIFDISLLTLLPLSTYETTQNLLSLNTANDIQSSLQIATAHLYTGKETGTKSSPNIPRKDQHS